MTAFSESRPPVPCRRLHFDRDVATDALCAIGVLWDQARFYTEAVRVALREREPQPVMVEGAMAADDANRIYGDRYGVDWEYDVATFDGTGPGDPA